MNKTIGKNSSYGKKLLTIQSAIYEKEIFIGYYMLCRYINGKGYKRYGCNVGYDKSVGTKGKDRLSPCKILCPNSKDYYQVTRQRTIRLAEMGYIYLQKVVMEDSINLDVDWYRNKTRKDVFVLIVSRKTLLEKFIRENNCIKVSPFMEKLISRRKIKKKIKRC